MDPMNPNVNRDPNACGILISRATAVVIQGNTTDANAGPGLRIAAAECKIRLTAPGLVFSHRHIFRAQARAWSGARNNAVDSLYT